MFEVINYIRNHGTKAKPVTNAEISAKLNIGNVNIRKMINQARAEGHPICSCNSGYYYSEDKTEILNTVQSLMHRTMAVERAISGLLSTLRYGEGENVNG